NTCSRSPACTSIQTTREGTPLVILFRSIAFNVLFYLNTIIYLLIALPTFFMPYRAIIAVAKSWGRTNLVLLSLFDNPLFIVKRELEWIPIFGWLMIKGRMVPIDRSAGSQALIAMTGRAKVELAAGRQLIIFPEGTRRPANAEPRYKFGVA